MQKNVEAKVTAIIGGTTQRGMEIARDALRNNGAVALLDSKKDDSVAILAGEKLSTGKFPSGGIIFQEVDMTAPETVFRALSAAQGHFGKPVDEVVNASGIGFSASAGHKSVAG